MTPSDYDKKVEEAAGDYECETTHSDRQWDENAYKYRDFVNGALWCRKNPPPEVMALVEALRFYTNYDKETVRHMDTEFLEPERRAIIKPLDKLGKGYAPKDMHPSQIYQDDCFTYGPKERPGKVARKALAQFEKATK